MDRQIDAAASELVRLLLSKNMTVTFAESCTAGLCAASLCNVSGASAVFKGSVVTYCDEMKNRLIGVSLETLEKHSAYSAECALEMSRGAAALVGADVGVGVTGIAGPGGATEKDPVGTVYVSVWSENAHYYKRFSFEGDRTAVRKSSVVEAFRMALELITGCGE